MQSTLQFCGGAGFVTGSNFLLTLEETKTKFLIDCGLVQGTKDMERLNWEPFPYDPKDISYLIITHAHIDHIGRIPKLVREGFGGVILSTEPTKALAQPLLTNAFELLSQTVSSEHKDPLYEEKDIAAAMRLWETIPLHHSKELKDGLSVELFSSGHILGSSMARFTREGKRIVFTGDLGGGNSPLLSYAEKLPSADYLVMESVYGDRTRKEDVHRLQTLERVIKETTARHGTLLIPAFSMERTQDLLYDIRGLLQEEKIPSLPVYLDSPLAEEVTTIYTQYPEYFAPDIAGAMKKGEHIFSFPELKWIRGPEESRLLLHTKNPKIILAGSGMSSGGRAISHEETLLSDTTATVLIVGYQAPGTVGRHLINGLKKVRIQGKEVAVRCHIEHIYGYSAHMDGEELLSFAEQGKEFLKHVYVVMGEPVSSSFLSQRINEYLGIKATAPEVGEKVGLEV